MLAAPESPAMPAVSWMACSDQLTGMRKVVAFALREGPTALTSACIIVNPAYNHEPLGARPMAAKYVWVSAGGGSHSLSAVPAPDLTIERSKAS